MSLVPLSPTTPRSFRDPLYARLAALAEERYGLPRGILDAIRTRGERSDADQVSSAGARTVYQFIEPTRRGFIKNYGIDPWKNPESATNAAAIHLRDDYKRTGSWDEAIARYHGGQRPRDASRTYAKRVGSFDKDQIMPSMYPVPYYGADPLAPLPDPQLAPEPMKTVAPVPGDPGPSAVMGATAPVAARKRGGILGALESVFMPEPDSLWASALRNGMFDAKAGQQAYRQAQYDNALKTAEAEAKLKSLITKGEYQVVGNNVFHIPADGSPPEMIGPPTQPDVKERLIDRWRQLDAGDPTKDLIERILVGANSDAALQSKERQASTRAGATVSSARIRASKPSASSVPPIPQGWSVVK